MVFSFSYIVRKAPLDGFKNISYEISGNFMIFGKLKHDFLTNKTQKLKKTSRGGLIASKI
jgi:hypothetical protein